jgi:hypothetical protein
VIKVKDVFGAIRSWSDPLIELHDWPISPCGFDNASLNVICKSISFSIQR